MSDTNNTSQSQPNPRNNPKNDSSVKQYKPQPRSDNLAITPAIDPSIKPTNKTITPSVASTYQTTANSKPVPKGMPTITENHKQTSKSQKKPFQPAFLLPKFWAIWLVAAILLPMIFLPLRWQFWLGRKLGILVYHLSKSRQHIALVNLSLAFPEKSEEDRVRLAKQVFVNQGIGLFETLCAWYRPNVFTRTLSISGIQHLITAQNEGRAVLLLGAHYTMLDLGGRLMTQFTPVDCVYRPQNNPLIDWFIFNGRRHTFDEQIEHRDMRKLVSRIQSGKVIWYSPDQDYGLKHGVMAPFFGIPAATITAPRRLAKLGKKSNPPAVMALHTYRQTPDNLPRGKRPHYHLTVTPVVENYPSSDEVADATRINELFEGLIRIDPSQWMWFHKRYKNNETGTTDYYK